MVRSEKAAAAEQSIHSDKLALYAVLVGDVVGVSILLLLSRFFDLRVLGAIGFPALLVSNFLFLRRRRKAIGTAPLEEAPLGRSRFFSAYACAAIFFFGTLYGILGISEGKLPRAVAPLLLIPLSMALYSVKTARRLRARKQS